MISITLNFKSIEAARAALLEIPVTALVGGVEADKQNAEVKPAKTAKPAKQEPVQEAAPEVKAEPQAAEAPAEEQPAAVDYPTLQKAVFALAALNREAVVATASSFGVKTFKELDQGKWAAALEAVQAKLAELKAAA